MNEKLWEALSNVQSGRMSGPAAATKYGVSFATLHRRIHNVAANPSVRSAKLKKSLAADKWDL